MVCDGEERRLVPRVCGFIRIRELNIHWTERDTTAESNSIGPGREPITIINFGSLSLAGIDFIVSGQSARTRKPGRSIRAHKV